MKQLTLLFPEPRTAPQLAMKKPRKIKPRRPRGADEDPYYWAAFMAPTEREYAQFLKENGEL
jgi:hypothetical protein